MKHLHPFCVKHKVTTNVNAHQNDYVKDPENLKEHKPAEILDMCCVQVKSKIQDIVHGKNHETQQQMTKEEQESYNKQLDKIAIEITNDANATHIGTKGKVQQSKGDHEKMAQRHGDYMKFMACTTVTCNNDAHCEADQKKMSAVHSKFKKIVAKAKSLAKPVHDNKKPAA